jgi:hypothetical protein
MLCHTCGQDNELGSIRCFQCQASLLPKSKNITPDPALDVKETKSSSTYTWLGLLASIFIFQLSAPHIFTRESEGINLLQVFCAALVGAVGAGLGKAIDKSRSK